MKEYVGDQLDRKKRKNNLHNTKKLMKDCGDRNNWRNNDVFSVTQANGMLKSEDSVNPMANRSTNLGETENTIIKILDHFKKKMS